MKSQCANWEWGVFTRVSNGFEGLRSLDCPSLVNTHMATRNLRIQALKLEVRANVSGETVLWLAKRFAFFRFRFRLFRNFRNLAKLAQTSEISETWRNIRNMAKLPKYDEISPNFRNCPNLPILFFCIHVTINK